MRGTFRRDLTLAPGPGFRLTRRLSARAFSVLLAVAAVGWGAYDLWAGHRLVGAATVALAIAFVFQLVQAELAGWRFEGAELRSRTLTLKAAEIEGVHLAFEGRRARAWVTTLDGEQVALVEGEEREVRRIADRLSGALRLAVLPPGRTIN
ncbi:MAG TPA: hypothetical protein VMK66_01690 [Myxococcales bacterium]|nr:hypothetical protein [Myxococcales bacterium]